MRVQYGGQDCTPPHLLRLMTKSAITLAQIPAHRERRAAGDKFDLSPRRGANVADQRKLNREFATGWGTVLQKTGSHSRAAHWSDSERF
jgi:hypothetical protein